MPWVIKQVEEEWCVFKEGEDGEAEGESLGCHPSEKEAKEKQAALYANEKAFGFKVADGSWVGWWTNAFEDRQKETFRQAAIDEYIQWANEQKALPPLWYWHVPVPIGETQVLGRVGHVAVAAGTLNEKGKALWKGLEKHPELGDAMSHGFVYKRGTKGEDGTIPWFRSYELTVCPSRVAANSLTMVLGGKVAMNEEQKKALTALLGEAVATEFVEQTEKASGMLEAAGLQWKTDETQPVESEEPKKDEPLVLTMGPEALQSIAQAVVAALQPQMNALDDGVKSVMSRVEEELSGATKALTELAKSEDTRIAEKVGQLPRVTAYRPTAEGQKTTGGAEVIAGKPGEHYTKTLQESVAEILASRNAGR